MLLTGRCQICRRGHFCMITRLHRFNFIFQFFLSVFFLLSVLHLTLGCFFFGYTFFFVIYFFTITVTPYPWLEFLLFYLISFCFLLVHKWLFEKNVFLQRFPFVLNCFRENWPVPILYIKEKYRFVRTIRKLINKMF